MMDEQEKQQEQEDVDMGPEEDEDRGFIPELEDIAEMSLEMSVRLLTDPDNKSGQAYRKVMKDIVKEALLDIRNDHTADREAEPQEKRPPRSGSIEKRVHALNELGRIYRYNCFSPLEGDHILAALSHAARDLAVLAGSARSGETGTTVQPSVAAEPEIIEGKPED